MEVSRALLSLCLCSLPRVLALAPSAAALLHNDTCVFVRQEDNYGGMQDTRGYSTQEFLSQGHVYQFGVFNGNSLKKLSGIYTDSVLWGFDTFEGMPQLSDHSSSHIRAWQPGTFKSDRFYPGMSFEERVAAMERCLRDSECVLQNGPKRPSEPSAQILAEQRTPRFRAGSTVMRNVHLIPGRYDQSLSHDLIASKGMQQAMYVDIDCDLYSSSLTALDWLFENGIVRVGTVIGYDDWWDPVCISGRGVHPFAIKGEAMAHAEIAAKYAVQFRCICGPCKRGPRARLAWRPYFLVVAIGSNKSASHGFHMSNTDVGEYVRSNPKCSTYARYGRTYKWGPIAMTNGAYSGRNTYARYRTILKD